MSDDDFIDPLYDARHDEESHDFEEQARLDELYLKAYTGQLDHDDFEPVKPAQDHSRQTNAESADEDEDQDADVEDIEGEEGGEGEDSSEIEAAAASNFLKTKASENIQFKNGTFFVDTPQDSTSNKRKRDDQDDDTRNRKRARLSEPLPPRPPLRYWEENKTQFTVKCFRCGKMGHMSANCTEDAKVERCALCGSVDHNSNKCPEELCHKCKQPGHMRRDCPNKGFLMPPCYLCRRSGHDPSMCQDLLPLEEKNAYCANCATKGHTARACKEPSTDDYRNMGQRGNWEQTAAKIRRRASTGDLRFEEKSFGQRYAEGIRRDHLARRR